MNTDIRLIIWNALKKHAFRSVLTAAVIVCSLILEAVPPLVLGKAVDALGTGGAVSLGLAVGYFAVLACSGLSDALREGLITACGEGITHALRTAMAAKLHRLPSSNFINEEAGKTASVLVDDVDAVEDLFSSGIVSLITDLGSVCVILGVVFYKSRGLGVILLIVLPLLFLFTRHVQKKMLKAHLERRKASAAASGLLPETLHVIRSLHVYHAQKAAEKRYDHAIQDTFRAVEKTNYYDAVYSPVIMTVSAAVIAVMMSLSGQSGMFRSWFGMSVGTAVTMISYVNSIFTPLSSIGMEIQTIQSAAAGWHRVQAFLQQPEEDKCRETESRGKEGGVDVRNVCFGYDPSHPVLTDFSLHVNPDEFVTIAGRTGAGKSTLFRLLLGLYQPQKGSISVNGRSPQAIDESEKRKTICCVEQKVVSVPGTIRDQVTLGNPGYSDEMVWQALATAGLKETVQSMEMRLDTPYSDSILSQGQKQLLMIARALVSDPQVLLLDEISSGLDSSTEKMVFDAIQRASDNRTVLNISHRLSSVRQGRMVKIR